MHIPQLMVRCSRSQATSLEPCTPKSCTLGATQAMQQSSKVRVRTRARLHAIHQRPGDGVQHVGRAHEEHLGQVHRHVQVVVHEAAVLRRVQQLQQRAGRVALVACAWAGVSSSVSVSSTSTRASNAQHGDGWLAQEVARVGQAIRASSALPSCLIPQSAPRPSLSISSISTRGLDVPVLLRHCTTLPGMAPTYVRLWPAPARSRHAGPCCSRLGPYVPHINMHACAACM